MSSRFIVPIHLVDYTTTTPVHINNPGFTEMYFKLTNLKKVVNNVEYDIVLERKLDNFSIVSLSASQVTSADSVLTSLQKLQKSLSSITLIGDVSGTASYSGGNLIITTNLAGSLIESDPFFTAWLGTNPLADYLPLAGGTMDPGSHIYFGTGGQNISQGGFDTGRSGDKGISLTCALGLELNWQAGYLRNFDTSGVGTPIPIYSDSEFIYSNVVSVTPSVGTSLVTKDYVNSLGFLTSAITSLNGTTNRIVTSGNTIDISTNYVGQSSITTLGTISTGTWNGTTITGTYGGTGVNNGARTITIAGNLTTTGAFNTTFAQQGSFTYTLPNATTLITGSAAVLTANVLPYVTTNGLIADSLLTWDNTNRFLIAATSLRVGIVANNAIDWASGSITVTSSNINLTASSQIINTVNTNGFKIQNNRDSSSAVGYTMLNDKTSHFGNIQSAIAYGSSFTLQGVGGTLSGTVIGYHPNGNIITATTSGSSSTVNLSASYIISGRNDQLSQGDRIEFYTAAAPSGSIDGVRQNIVATASNALSLTLDTPVNYASARYLRVYRALMKVYDYSGVMKFHMTNDGLVGIGLNTSVSPTNAITFPKALLSLGASTTLVASLNIASGTAPTSPNNGDIWFDGTDIKMRIGGVTKTFTLLP